MYLKAPVCACGCHVCLYLPRVCLCPVADLMWVRPVCVLTTEQSRSAGAEVMDDVWKLWSCSGCCHSSGRQLRMMDAPEAAYTCGLAWLRMSDSLLMEATFQVSFEHY